MTDATGTVKIPGVLLAGGLARRMGGGDKPMRTIAGRTILDRVIARLKPQCDGLILNANGDPARFAAFGLPVIADGVADFPGPLAGILAALDWAAVNRPDVALVLSAAADCPFLPRDLVSRLHGALDGGEGRACGRRFRRPIASGDRAVERGFARATPPRACRRRRQENRPLDRALQARHRDMAGRRRSIRSSTPTPWTTLPRQTGWRRWMGVDSTLSVVPALVRNCAPGGDDGGID